MPLSRLVRLFCYGLPLLAACAARTELPSRPTATAPAPEPRPEAAVYAALLDSVYMDSPVPDTLAIGDSTVVVVDGLASSRYARADSVPRGLAFALERLSQTRQATASLPFPRPIYVVTKPTEREIFSHGLRGGWIEFHRRYPNQHGLLRVSPVALSADTVDALVYYEYRCGGLCGSGGIAWITRRGTSHWHVRKITHVWSS